MSDVNANEENVVEENAVSTEVDATVETSGDLDVDSLESFIDVTDEDLSGIVTEDENSDAPVVTSTVVAAPVVAPKLSFADRAEAMGLTVMLGGTYHYEDEFSAIAYKQVKTLIGSGIVDDTELTHLAIFTKGIAENDEWKYQNFISDSYQFLGNATLIDQIKASINEVGTVELQERTFVAPNNAEIRHEIIIGHGTEIPEVGSMLPMMHITNTYNGTGASSITFGMTIVESPELSSSLSSEKFGKLKQIHLSGSSAELSAQIGEYVTIFNTNIQACVAENMAIPVTQVHMDKLLAKIQAKVGKKRHDVIKAELTPEEGSALAMTQWELFLALTRFTSVEKNISSKKLLESVVEGVLVLPYEMSEALKTING